MTQIPGESQPHARNTLEDEARASRLLIGFLLLICITLAFVSVLAFKLMRGYFSSLPQQQVRCREWEDSSCPPGSSCVEGQCVTFSRPENCQIGDSCPGKCSPHPDLECIDGRYAVIEGEDYCRDSDVLDFLSALSRKCGSASACKSTDLENYAIENEELYELLAKFPTTAVHFPSAKPKKFTNWPPARGREHYINGISPQQLQAIREADFVLFVITASQDGRPQSATTSVATENARLSFNRYELARDLLLEALKASGNERNQLIEKFKLAQVGDRRQIGIAEYMQMFRNRAVAWSPSASDRLRGLVEKGTALPDGANKRWRDATINQTVFIVPIRCSITNRVNTALTKVGMLDVD